MSKLTDFSQHEWNEIFGVGYGFHCITRDFLVGANGKRKLVEKYDIFIYNVEHHMKSLNIIRNVEKPVFDTDFKKQDLYNFKGYLVITPSSRKSFGHMYDLISKLQNVKGIIMHDDLDWSWSSSFLDYKNLEYVKMPKKVLYGGYLFSSEKLKSILIPEDSIMYCCVNAFTLCKRIESVEIYQLDQNDQMRNGNYLPQLWDIPFPVYNGLHRKSALRRLLIGMATSIPGYEDDWESKNYQSGYQKGIRDYTYLDVFFWKLFLELKYQRIPDYVDGAVNMTSINHNKERYDCQIRQLREKEKKIELKLCADFKLHYLKGLDQRTWNHMKQLDSGFHTIRVDGCKFHIFLYDTIVDGVFNTELIENFTGTIVIKPGCTEINSHGLFRKSTVSDEMYNYILSSNCSETYEDREYNYLVKFANASSLLMPEGVEKMGEGVFWGCLNLRFIRLSSTIRECGNFVFNSKRLERVYIPSGIKLTGNRVFHGCEQLKCLLVDHEFYSENYWVPVNSPLMNISQVYDAFDDNSPIKQTLYGLCERIFGLDKEELERMHYGFHTGDKGLGPDYDNPSFPDRVWVSVVDGLFYNLLYSGYDMSDFELACCRRYGGPNIISRLHVNDLEYFWWKLVMDKEGGLYRTTLLEYMSSNLSTDYNQMDVMKSIIQHLMGEIEYIK